MLPDTFHAEGSSDPATGAAVIRPVTPAMMDEAAHRAAQLADDVAHHLAPAPVPEAVSSSDAAPPEPAAAMDESLRSVQDVATDAAETVQAAATGMAASAAHQAEALQSATGSALVSAAETVDDTVRAAAARSGAALSGAADRPLSGGVEALSQYNAALLGLVQANLSATGDLVAALSRARSLPEIVAINTDHLRRQMDAAATQGRALAEITQRFATTALLPFSGIARKAP